MTSPIPSPTHARILERALSNFWYRSPEVCLRSAVLGAVLMAIVAMGAAAWAQDKPVREYQVRYSGAFKPSSGFFAARIDVSQDSHLLRLLDFSAPESKYYHFSGDGEIQRVEDHVLWTVPETGGSLHYEVRVDHRRGDRLDAHLSEKWALVRLDDLFPPARVLSRAGAESRATLEFTGPSGWLFETPYGPVSDAIDVNNPSRRFDRPIGWLAAGKLGIRREIIADRRVAVAAPIEQGMRRLDILAFMGWVLPDLIEVFPQFPDRLLVTGARDEMWRGALSGPGSLYVHADRPLLSENGTSTILHELVHVACGLSQGPRDDWVMEGLAEYYSLEILRRSGGLSTERWEASMDELAAWAKRGKGTLRSPSTGPHTAQAVTVFRDIQKELAAKKAGKLDAIVRDMLDGDAMTGARLLALVETALGEPSKSLRPHLESPEARESSDNE